ncbi:olfactory receptor 1500-like [Ranitomeya imitator]|uniref:olfactory receptor 1500-like n=1 Tax=Ranitomeya imitator TaxID=111125 RepID=UPI0037E81ABB
MATNMVSTDVAIIIITIPVIYMLWVPWEGGLQSSRGALDKRQDVIKGVGTKEQMEEEEDKEEEVMGAQQPASAPAEQIATLTRNERLEKVVQEYFKLNVNALRGVDSLLFAIQKWNSAGSPSDGLPVVEEAYYDVSTLRKLIMSSNLTVVTEFFLLGFQIRQSLRISLFCLLLVVFCGTICGNLLIITLVSTTKSLHTPMYFFISQLSLSDILVITNIVPNLLQVLLNNGGSIDFVDCITQLYFLCAPEVFECFLLAVMSYDRYVAICNPLRYSTIMTSAHCVISSIMCWMFGFSFVLIYIVKMAKLNFCGPNIIDHLFCDIVPLLEISCSDTFIVHLEIAVMVIPIVIIPTIIIVLSYTFIVSAVLKIKSNVSRQKAFSTCSSHLIVVSIFYWTMFGVYVFPTKGRTLTMSKILSLLYTVFTPFINPIIYSLRNKDIWKAILKHANW